MEILQPYNNNTLQLISDVEDYQFQESDLVDGVIKLSVFSDVGSFQDFKDLEQGKDFYVKNNELFLKHQVLDYIHNNFDKKSISKDIAENLKILFHRAMLTGKPDLFGPELREIWLGY